MNEPRKAVVLGGAGGIGSAICRRLAAEGYRVTVGDLSADGAAQIASAMPGNGHEAIALDITDPAAVDAAFDKIEKQSAAAVLVVASGGLIVDPTAVPNVATLSISDWDRTVALNLSGVFFCIRKFAQQRLAKPVEHGRIIVIGSGVGQIAGSPTDLGYVSSKAAIIGLVRQVAFDLAPAGITVNTVAPGPVGTPEFLRKTNAAIQQFVAGTTLVKRLGEPEEIAAGVAYLASHDASYVTGTTLDINGGVHMH